MKILVITRSPWDDSNNTGNTMTNFFENWPSAEIANIYMREAKPHNAVCKTYYSISDRDIAKSIFKRNYKAGKLFEWDISESKSVEITNNKVKNEEVMYNLFRQKSSVFALWGQDILWQMGNWKNDRLDDFLTSFNPDIIFSPSFYTRYTHKLMWYIQEKTNAKLVLFHGDDYIFSTVKNKSLLKKINQKIRTATITKSVIKSDLNYCISPKQMEEYSTHFNKEMKLLFKGKDFDEFPEYSLNVEEPIIIRYIGSILYGRWKTLSLLAKKIQEINSESGKTVFILDIYSQYIPSQSQLESMVIEGSSKFNGKISPNEVSKKLKESDIVLHLESFESDEKMATRLSFSTKIVDCFHSGRPIMAIGWEEAASITYLESNDVAIVSTNENEIKDKLIRILNSPTILETYAKKSWDFGKENHQIELIQKKLYNDFQSVIGERNL